MLRLKSCPKCHGDVRFDRDQFGWYEQCIQCGFVRDLEPMALSAPAGGEASPWQEAGKHLSPITPFGSHTEYTDKGLR